MHHHEDPNTVVDELTGREYSSDELAEYEFGQEYLQRDPELADQSLSDFDESHRLDLYADDIPDSDCY